MLKNKLVTDAVDYHTNRLNKKSARYVDAPAKKFNKITKKTAVQIKDETFSGKDNVYIIASLQDFKATCHACNIHGRAEM